MRTLKLVIENYEFEVPVFQMNGRSWVALKPICEILGVDPWSQQRKVLSNEFIRYSHMTVPSAGGNQTMLCVDINSIGEWIFGINPNKVKPEIKERMVLFRSKLQYVLYAAVTGHVDGDMVRSLIQEIGELKGIIGKLTDIIERHEQTIKTQGATINYLVQKGALGEYQAKTMASFGGKLLSQQAHRKRNSPQVA